MLVRRPTNPGPRENIGARDRARSAASGQALVLFAAFAFVLVGFMALAIDGGLILAERRQVQAAADAAALAAARVALDGFPELMEDSAVAYGLANAGDNATVEMFHPPATGNYAGDDGYVQIVVRMDVQQYFIGAIYSGPWSVSASATAGIELDGGNYALITLNRTTTPGIYLNGNTGIVITGDEASAMSNTNIHSNGVPSFTTTGYIDAHTTIAVGGGAWNPPNRRRENQPQIDNPLQDVSPPAPPATLRTFAADCPGNVCQPGRYRNQDVTLSGTYTFAPGLYYFENTDIGLQNTNARIQGTGVTFYFDENSSFDPKNGDVHLVGPTTSLYADGQDGMVFWYASCSTLDMQGNGNLYFSGIVYAPCALVKMHGTPGQDTVRGQLIVDRLDVRGTSDMRISYNSWVDTSRPRIYLVE